MRSVGVSKTTEELSQFIEGLRDPADTPRPIHIGGCPRSGTTLVATLLGVGPDCLTVPEARFKWPLLGRVGDAGKLPLGDAIRLVQQDWKFAHWRVLIPSSHTLDRPITFQAFLRTLVLLHGQSVGKADPLVWIDHTPANARYAVTLDRYLDQAKFVHVIRDGRGVAASIIPLDWGPNHIFEAAAHWAQQLASGLAAASALGPSKACAIRYEDITCQSESTVKRLCGQLDIEYRPDMLTQRDYRVLRYTDGQHRLVENPLDSSRATAWRTALGARELETFEYLTGDLLECLGYELEFGMKARPPRRIRRAADESVGAIRRQLNKVQKLARRRRLGNLLQ